MASPKEARTLRILSLVILGLSAAWFAFDGGFEPLITGLASLAGLVTTFRGTPKDGSQHTRSVAGPADRKSIVVLPFDNMSPDDGDAYFADGLTEEIITQLSQLRSLRVISRNSAMVFKDTRKDTRTIGRELDVQYVMEGSVRRAGESLRITAQLIQAETDEHLWAETFARDFEDVFEIQTEIARGVTSKLCDTVPGQGGDDGTLLRPRTDDLIAYESYLRGLFFYWQYSSEGAARALKSFDDALERDPDYALAHAGASLAHTWLAGFGHEATESTPERARKSAQRALELEPSLPEGLISLAEVLFWLDWDFEGATRAVLQAIQLSPSSVVAHTLYSFCLRARGRFDDAVAELETAVELDPLSVPVHNELGNAYLAAGRQDEGEAQIARTLRLDSEFAPTLETLGWLSVRAGQLDEALRIFESLPPGRFSTMAALGFTFAMLGRTGEALKQLAALEEASREQRVANHVHVARIHAGLGKIDEAIRHLERAIDRRAIPAILLASSVRDWGRLLHDPRFQQVLKRLEHA